MENSIKGTFVASFRINSGMESFILDFKVKLPEGFTNPQNKKEVLDYAIAECGVLDTFHNKLLEYIAWETNNLFDAILRYENAEGQWSVSNFRVETFL